MNSNKKIVLEKTHLLGVGITNESEDKILEYLFSSLEKNSQKYYITTPNPEILVYAASHPDYKKILNHARIALPDGIGVFLALGLMGSRLKERITGVDFMEEVCSKSAGRVISIGFLGGREGVAEKTAECLKAKYPWLNIVFTGEEWDKANTESKNIDILFVAFGHPLQEVWIYNNLDKLPVKVAMGVGGAFDYISGEVSRAPFIIRAVGFEWLYRLVKQPWRWKRQLSLLRFIVLAAREGIKSLSSSK